MGGHASHGHASDLVFMKRGYGEETVIWDCVVIGDFESLNFRKVKRPWKVPFSGRIRCCAGLVFTSEVRFWTREETSTNPMATIFVASEVRCGTHSLDYTQKRLAEKAD